MNLVELKNAVLNGYQVTKEDVEILKTAPIEELKKCANEIRTILCGTDFDMCSIINGKSGKCTENCKFCSQSRNHHTSCDVYPLLDLDPILKECKTNEQNGIRRFSIVTSGKRLSKAEVDKLSSIYEYLHKNVNIKLCASCGLLDYDDFVKLKNSGVTRIHNNLETSRNYFKYICTTHTYDEKIKAIKDAQRAGLVVCSGGIIGLGESMDDRIDLAFELKNLNILSIPLNVLCPIPGTPLENNPILSTEEITRVISIFRFINPKAVIRTAGGRLQLENNGLEMFKSGSNGCITQNMLTTSGTNVLDDIEMLRKLGFTFDE